MPADAIAVHRPSRFPKPPKDKAQRTGPPRVTLILPETAAAGRVRCSARLGVLDLAADAVEPPEVLELEGPGVAMRKTHQWNSMPSSLASSTASRWKSG